MNLMHYLMFLILIEILLCDRLLIQLDETEKNFDTFWADHEKKLQQCLKLRLFEQDFREVCMKTLLFTVNFLSKYLILNNMLV